MVFLRNLHLLCKFSAQKEFQSFVFFVFLSFVSFFIVKKKAAIKFSLSLAQPIHSSTLQIMEKVPSLETCRDESKWNPEFDNGIFELYKLWYEVKSEFLDL